jgi:hypothetical protein
MIKYSYLKAKTPSNRYGYIAVAMNRPGKESPDQTHIVSFAFCSPKDSFKKSLGRKIAEARLEKKSVIIPTGGTIGDVTSKALRILIDANVAPSWVRKAFVHNNISNLKQKEIKKQQLLSA